MPALLDLTADVNQTLEFYVSWLSNTDNNITATMQGTFEVRLETGSYVPIILNNSTTLGGYVFVNSDNTVFVVHVAASQLLSLGIGQFYYNLTILDPSNNNNVTILEGNFIITGNPRS